MKWILLAVLVVLALLAGGYSLLLAADPEGRGGDAALAWLFCAIGLLVGAGSLVIWG